MSRHGHTIVESLLLQDNPLLDKEWIKKKLSICPFGTLDVRGLVRRLRCLEANVSTRAVVLFLYSRVQ